MRVEFVNQDRLLANLKRLGFDAKTVFDVGVANGTPWLYSAYPNAYFYLIEPVPGFRPAIQAHLRKLRGRHIPAALASQPGTAKFFIPKEPARQNIATLSFKPEMVSSQDVVDVAVTTLDIVAQGEALAQPILLKTDCQGYDLEAAKGGVETLKQIDVVITETPVYGPWGGGAELKDYLDFYYAHNFILYDLVQPLRRPDDDRLHSVDLCFVNLRSPMAARGLYTSGKETLARSRKHYGV